MPRNKQARSEMKRIVGTMAAAFAAAAAQASTLAWFHFDERDPGYVFESVGPGVVTNACNAATQVYTYATEGSSSGATPSAYMPRYTTPAYGTQIYDPVSGCRWRNRASMRFTTGTTSGKGGSYYGSTLKVPGSDKSFQPTDAFTIECFVCTTGGVFDTFSPIFGKRNSNDYANESWALYLARNGSLAARLTTSGSSSPKIYGPSSPYGMGVPIDDGSWHHVAMTYSKVDGICRVYVDYAESFTFPTKAGGIGETVSYNASYTDDRSAFHIGGYPWVNGSSVGRKFNGCIDELRISDVALSPAQFLRLQPEDADELVRLRFDPHNLAETAVSTNGNYNDRLDLPAKFSMTGGTVSLDAVEKRAASIRDGMLAAAVQDGGSYSAATNGSGKSGYFTVTNLLWAMTGGNAEVTNHGYTVEAFFKTRSASEDSRKEQTVFKFGTKPAVQVLLYHYSKQMDDAGVFTPNRICFAYNDGYVWKDAYSDVDGVCDAGWHHVAVVCDPVRRQMRFYLDGRLTASAANVKNVVKAADRDFYIGAKNGGGQEFDGWIDEVRVMNRALSPDEFLTTHDVGNVDASDPTIALMDFEDSYATSPYPGLVGAGEGAAHSSSGAAPEFVRRDRTYLLDGTNGSAEVVGTRCLKFADSHAAWPYSPLFEQESFTVEFFANITELVSGGSILRYVGGVDSLTADPVWALYRDPSTDSLCLRIQLVKNGTSAGNYQAKWPFAVSSTDRGWHHYAFTLEPRDGTNTVVEFFRDYASAGASELQGRVDYAFGSGGRLTIGAGATGNKVYGSYDMLRFSKGILPPEKFITKVNVGTVLVVH